MEVSYPKSPLELVFNVNQNTAEMEVDSIDLDIDLGSVDDYNELSPTTNTIAEYTVPSIQLSDHDLVSHKVYIRGLEDLTTYDIKAFSEQLYPPNSPHVEWIDDTSANLIFEGEETAMAALRNFTLASSESGSLPPSQLRAARTLSSRPGSSLYVRIATVTDRKRPRAYEASRFYMMHPEHDPRENGRRVGSFKGNSGYSRKGYSDDEHQRRRRRDKEDRFDASMYDDGGPSSRRDSILSSANEGGIEGRRNTRLSGDFYRPARKERNRTYVPRDRSASPSRHNRHTPPPTYRSRDPYPFPYENEGKELFPSISGSDRDTYCNAKDLFESKMLTAGIASRLYSEKPAFVREVASNGKDPFSNRTRAAEVKKELFPHKVNSSKHSRSDAFDAADETADLFAHRMSVPFTTGPSARMSPINRLGPLGSASQVDGEDFGLNIRGASREQNQGISIRGVAPVNATGTIKELFPGKAAGNAGKELFAEKVEGRGGRRNRAEDMFY